MKNTIHFFSLLVKYVSLRGSDFTSWSLAVNVIACKACFWFCLTVSMLK